MSERDASLLGLLGCLLPYVFIATSIALSPWFSWSRNALSDLGHSFKSPVAPIFNLGLLLGGFLLALYSLDSLRRRAPKTSLVFAAVAFNLQLVGAFDEVYGRLHLAVSISFFVLMLISSLTYWFETGRRLALISFTIGLLSWILYWLKVYSAGIAVPETVSSLTAVAWVVEDSVLSLKSTRSRRIDQQRPISASRFRSP